MGLIPIFPFGANLTGNIAVTMVLAVIVFVVVNFSGNKHKQHNHASINISQIRTSFSQYQLDSSRNEGMQYNNK